MRQNLGQHFLRNPGAAKKIAAALQWGSEEALIEIGPGHGELTQAILDAGAPGRFVVIERDPDLAEHMRARFGGKIEVVEGDVIQELPRLTRSMNGGYSLVGNLPYYLTGFLLRTIGELDQKPRHSVFMVQKEVAERLAAKPPHFNRLAAAVQYWAKPHLLFLVHREEFLPPPEVDSAVIRLEAESFRPDRNQRDDQLYYKMLHVLFQQPRKTVLNNLAAGFGEMDKDELANALESVGVAPESRPQNVSVDQLILLAGLECFKA